MKKIVITILAITALALVFFALKNIPAKNSVQTDKLQVVTSFYPLYFFASEIGGDKTQIFNLTPAGAEPHDYEPTGRDIARVENSKLLVLNGGLEAWADNLKQNLSSNTFVVTAGENLFKKSADQNSFDPHIWLSPQLAGKMVDKIKEGFIQVNPENEDYYQNNADVLKSKLTELDKKFQEGLKDCSEKNIITSHSAFGYLASDYDLNEVSITGLSPDAEPSPRQLAEVAEFAKINKVKYIFFESLVSPKLSQTIAQEIGADTLVFNPLEGLTEEEINQGKNYFTEMENNLTNLKIALRCQ